MAGLTSKDEEQQLRGEALVMLRHALLGSTNIEAQLPSLTRQISEERTAVEVELRAAAQTEVQHLEAASRLTQNASECLGLLQDETEHLRSVLNTRVRVPGIDLLRQLEQVRSKLTKAYEWSQALQQTNTAELASMIKRGRLEDAYSIISGFQRLRIEVLNLLKADKKNPGKHVTEIASIIRQRIPEMDKVITMLSKSAGEACRKAPLSALASLIEPGAKTQECIKGAKAAIAVAKIEEYAPCLRCTGESDPTGLVGDYAGAEKPGLTLSGLLIYFRSGADSVFFEEVLAGVENPLSDVPTLSASLRDVEQFMAAMEEALLPLGVDVGSTVNNQLHRGIIRLLSSATDRAVCPATGTELFQLLELCEWYRMHCISQGWMTDSSDFDAVETGLIFEVMQRLRRELAAIATGAINSAQTRPVDTDVQHPISFASKDFAVAMVAMTEPVVKLADAAHVLRGLAGVIISELTHFIEIQYQTLDWPEGAGYLEEDTDDIRQVVWVQRQLVASNGLVDLGACLRGRMRDAFNLDELWAGSGPFASLTEIIHDGCDALYARMIQHAIAEHNWNLMLGPVLEKSKEAAQSIAIDTSEYLAGAHDLLPGSNVVLFCNATLNVIFGRLASEVNRILTGRGKPDVAIVARGLKGVADAIRASWIPCLQNEQGRMDEYMREAQEILRRFFKASEVVYSFLTARSTSDFGMIAKMKLRGDFPGVKIAVVERIASWRSDWSNDERNKAIKAGRNGLRRGNDTQRVLSKDELEAIHVFLQS